MLIEIVYPMVLFFKAITLIITYIPERIYNYLEGKANGKM